MLNISTLTGNYISEDQFNYYVHDVWRDIGDPTSAHLPFMGAPWGICYMVAGYLFMVYVWGPWYMKNREPFELRRAMLIYNFVNFLLNGIGFVVGFIYTNFSLDVWGCKEKYYPPFLLYLGYGYLMLKFIDFIDTLFFILRKKYNHVSFLHVTHHSLMPFTCYIGMKFVPYGNTAFTPLINSFIHTVMYAYYYMAALGPHMQPYLWWKKYLTVMQLIQFAIGIVHSLQVYFVPGCRYPKWVANFEFLEALYFFIVFYRFYQRTYATSKKQDVIKDKKSK